MSVFQILAAAEPLVSPMFCAEQAGSLRAVRQANARLQPARIEFGTGKAFVNTNRDEEIGEGYHMGYSPEGQSDKTVAVLAMTTPSGEPIAVYANYGTERVVLWGNATSVTCPGQRQAEPPKPGVPTAGYQAPPPSTVKEVDAEPVVIPLKLLMINDITLAGVSGEVFTEIGEHLKKDSLFDRTVMVTLLPNGVGYISYRQSLPAAFRKGRGIKPGCAEPAIINGLLNMEKQYLPIWKGAQ